MIIIFENVNLILEAENKELFNIQKNLLEKFEKENRENSENVVLQIALLQTLTPIADNFAAIEVLSAFPCEEFNTLIIGGYLCAECLEKTENLFLEKLLGQYENFNSFEKSVIKYIEALYIQNHKLKPQRAILDIILESISLCDTYTASFYFRYLITNDKADLIKAKENVKAILSFLEISSMTIYDFIQPKYFIEEHILMNRLSYVVYDDLLEI